MLFFSLFVSSKDAFSLYYPLFRCKLILYTGMLSSISLAKNTLEFKTTEVHLTYQLNFSSER